MKNSVIAIPSSYIVITTIIYALLVSIFFELSNAIRGENILVDDKDSYTVTYTQQLIETKCKSPCPETAELCVFMCA